MAAPPLLSSAAARIVVAIVVEYVLLMSYGRRAVAHGGSAFLDGPASPKTMAPNIRSDYSLRNTARHGEYQRNRKSALFSYDLDGRSISKPMQPVGRMVLVKPKEAVEKSPGGVYVPAEYREKQTVGRVTAVGNGMANEFTGVKIGMDVAVGDWVLFGLQEMNDIKYNGVKHSLIPMDSIYAKVKNDLGTVSAEDIKPLGDTVFIELLKREGKTAGGVFLSSESVSPSHDARVLSIGDGGYDAYGKRLEMEVQPGDCIRFSMFALEDREIKIKGERYAFIRMSDILAKW